jgi:hypothetical protein
MPNINTTSTHVVCALLFISLILPTALAISVCPYDTPVLDNPLVWAFIMHTNLTTKKGITPFTLQTHPAYPTQFKEITVLCEISSSHGGEYDVQSCLLGSITQKTTLNKITVLVHSLTGIRSSNLAQAMTFVRSSLVTALWCKRTYDGLIHYPEALQKKNKMSKLKFLKVYTYYIHTWRMCNDKLCDIQDTNRVVQHDSKVSMEM